MRVDNLQFKLANEASAQTPRYVVAILYDVGSLYITSHSDIPNVPGIILAGALDKPSAISQRIVPDEGRSEIGTFSFDVVDRNSDFTDEVRAKLAAGAGLRGRTVQLYVGFKGFDFSAFQLFQTQIVRDCSYDNGVYTVNCDDISRQARTNICDLKTTTLLATCSATDTTIQVADTSKFIAIAHGTAWSDAPSAIVNYFKIDREVIRATGKTATSFTGCTRGVMNTLAAVHSVDPASPQERRPKVEEFAYLDLPAPKLALAILTGCISSNWPGNFLGTNGDFEVDTNADGIADGWTMFTGDGGRVQTPTTPAGSAPFVGKCQRVLISSVTNSNDTGFEWSSGTNRAQGGVKMTLSAYVRTNVGGKVKLLLRFYDANSVIIADFSSGFCAGDSIGHQLSLTVDAPVNAVNLRAMVRGISAATEFMEFDRVMLEIGSTVHAYSSAAIGGLLPPHWHVGIEPEFVRTSDFTGIGVDLWDLTADAAGFTTRFEGITRTDGKRFLEKELYLLLGCYSPIYSDGALGLRRLPAMVSDAAPVATLTEREVISTSDLLHDFTSLHNSIHVFWGYDLGRGDFTRDSTFIDGTSVAIHGTAPPIDYEFRGLHSGIHTDNMIRTRLDAIRDAYSYPPERLTVNLLPTLNRFESGDVFRVKIKNVRDFAGASADIDRSFVALRRSIDFTSGDLTLEMFGSTLRPEALAPSTEAPPPMPDAYYTSAGVALNTVVGMTGNSVNAGTHSITGNANMTAAGAIVYHNGDLTIPNGATINISANVQLRVKGFITLNGVINGNATGLAGVADPGGGTLVSPIDGNPGFIGNSRGWDGVDMAVLVLLPPLQYFETIPVALAKAKYDAWPALNLEVNGSVLLGIPSDLRGTGGPPGGRTILTYTGGTMATGGTGGNGGAGLVIVCRGISFGVSAQINLNGGDTTTPGVTAIPLVDIYRGAGGAGGPGACLILLDGNALQFPNAAGRFNARTGTITQPGVPLIGRVMGFNKTNFQVNPDLDPFSGYADESVISNFDMSIAALRIQYIPTPQVPASDQDELPAPITALTVTPGAGFNTIRATLPELGSFDVVDYYAAITNNRAGAVLIARGRTGEFQHDLPVLATRYYWAQTTRLTPFGLERHSDFLPASPTGGIACTTLNPGGWTPLITEAGGATMIATSSSIEKSGGTGAFDSQVYSAEGYQACFVSFRAAVATSAIVVGLDVSPAADATRATIDFSWELRTDGTLRICENTNSGLNPSLSYDASTVLAIYYDGETVRYLRNAVVVREVLAPGLTLYLDSSFLTPGGKILDVKFGPQGSMTDGNRFVARGNCLYGGRTIQKVGGSAAWDSDCYSADGYTEGAFATARPNQTNAQMMFGLNSDPTTDQSYTSIDYAWYMTSGAGLEIYENGSSIATFGSYTTSTVLEIHFVGKKVLYLKDGVVVRAIAAAVAGALYFDSSFLSVGGTLTDVQFGPAGRGAEQDPNAVYLESFEQPIASRFLLLTTPATTTYPNNGEFGGKVIRAVGQLWAQCVENIPYDPTFLYRITTRIRRIASGSPNEKVYCGVAGVAADGVTLINEAGSNSTSSQHYNCARSFDMSAIGINTWQDFVGYFRGNATSGFGVAVNRDTPTPLYNGVKYFRPLVIMNYNAGSGTMECDFIKVERLIVPDDSDNTDKLRIVPDAEFERDTGVNFWLPYTSSGGSTAIALTGGAIGGKATLTSGGSSSAAALYSRRRPALQIVPGSFYTVTCRWRRTATIGATSGALAFGATRHAQDPTSATTFNQAGADVSFGYGQVVLVNADINARTVNVWQEDACTIWFPNDPAFANASLYLSAFAQIGGFASTELIEIDYLNCVPGMAAEPFILRYTDALGAATPLAETHFFKKFYHDSASNYQFNLPEAQTKYIGAKIYFEVRGTGTLTISAGSGSDFLRSSPGTTGNRALAGQYAKAFAECVSATEWLLTGQLA